MTYKIAKGLIASIGFFGLTCTQAAAQATIIQMQPASGWTTLYATKMKGTSRHFCLRATAKAGVVPMLVIRMSRLKDGDAKGTDSVKTVLGKDAETICLTMKPQFDHVIKAAAIHGSVELQAGTAACAFKDIKPGKTNICSGTKWPIMTVQNGQFQLD